MVVGTEVKWQSGVGAHNLGRYVHTCGEDISEGLSNEATFHLMSREKGITMLQNATW